MGLWFYGFKNLFETRKPDIAPVENQGPGFKNLLETRKPDIAPVGNLGNLGFLHPLSMASATTKIQ